MTEGVSVGICDDVLLWREEITDKVLAYQTEKQIQVCRNVFLTFPILQAFQSIH